MSVLPFPALRLLRSRRAWAQEGQGLAEYALILSLIAIVAISALIFIGDDITTLLSNTGQSV